MNMICLRDVLDEIYWIAKVLEGDGHRCAQDLFEITTKLDAFVVPEDDATPRLAPLSLDRKLDTADDPASSDAGSNASPTAGDNCGALGVACCDDAFINVFSKLGDTSINETVHGNDHELCDATATFASFRSDVDLAAPPDLIHVDETDGAASAEEEASRTELDDRESSPDLIHMDETDGAVSTEEEASQDTVVGEPAPSDKDIDDPGDASMSEIDDPPYVDEDGDTTSDDEDDPAPDVAPRRIERRLELGSDDVVFLTDSEYHGEDGRRHVLIYPLSSEPVAVNAAELDRCQSEGAPVAAVIGKLNACDSVHLMIAHDIIRARGHLRVKRAASSVGLDRRKACVVLKDSYKTLHVRGQVYMKRFWRLFFFFFFFFFFFLRAAVGRELESYAPVARIYALQGQL